MDNVRKDDVGLCPLKTKIMYKNICLEKGCSDPNGVLILSNILIFTKRNAHYHLCFD